MTSIEVPLLGSALGSSPLLSHVSIDALSDLIAVIDESGRIITVNKAWRCFGLDNNADPTMVFEGANYLDTCDRAAASNNADGAAAAALIRSVVSRQRDVATMEYKCRTPKELRWYKVSITGFDSRDHFQVVLVHEDITERKRAETEILFQANLLASVEQAVIATDLNGIIIYWNPFAEKLYGWKSSEVLGRHIVHVTPSDATYEHAVEIMTRLKKGESWSGEFDVRHRNGNAFSIHVTDSPIRDEDGELVGIIGISTDISDRKKSEQALGLAAMVYEAIGEAIMVVDANDAMVAVNPALMHLSGYAEKEVLGRSTRLLLSDRNGQDFFNKMHCHLEKTGHWQGKVWSRRKSGEEVLEWLMIDTLFDQHGQVKNRIGMFSPVTDQKLAEELIWHQANFDLLTGLPNRSMFQERLEHEIKKAVRSGLPFALMFIDLDGFKDINDTLGHDMGDILLQEAAQRLVRCIRQVDTVARLGGDEFTIILGELEDLDSVERVAREILQALAEPFFLKTETAYITASLGITLYPHDAARVDALLKNADQAMYAAKNLGRNRFNYFTPRMQQEALSRMRMVNDLRGVVESNQLYLLYQPIVELATGHIHKAEALVRWKHPSRGQVNPSDFVPIAEETGKIIGIGEWVFQQAVRQVAHWRRTVDSRFQISVNMSPVQFRKQCISRGHWLEHCQKCASRPQHESPDISIEITEGLLLEASPAITDQLLLLHDAGIQVSVDDFGTGYSSLSYLQRFHIDYLKIDQSFVRKMTAASDDLAICEAIVVMAHKLGIKVIAEGVETKEQRDLLAAAECDYAQGYLLSRPATPAALNGMLQGGYSW